MNMLCYRYGIVCLLCLLGACRTTRQKISTAEQHTFQQAQTQLWWDSTMRYWYFHTDSAFSYHPDSGLHTLSGRLMGWEFRVNHRKEQFTMDRESSYKDKVKGLTRDRQGIWRLSHYITIPLVMILLIAICYRIRVNITKT